MDPQETDPADLAASAVSVVAAAEVSGNEALDQERCTKRLVLGAARKQKSHSSQQKEDQSTVRTAFEHARIMKDSEGKVAKVEYTGTFDNGDVFDSNVGGEPLAFTIDTGQVIKGFNDAVKTMSVGEEKEFVISPDEGYGQPRQSLIITAPRTNFPAEIKIGQTLALQGPDGRQFPGKIVKINPEDVMIDFNHPLAGKTLHFKIKLLAVEEK